MSSSLQSDATAADASDAEAIPDAPAADALASDTAASDAPSPDAPAADTPAADALAADAVAADAVAADAAPVNALAADAPAVDATTAAFAKLIIATASDVSAADAIAKAAAIDAADKQQQQLLALDFFTSIVGEDEKIPAKYCTGMSVLRNVIKLETRKRRDIVIRDITVPFWRACIAMVDKPKRRCRVCAIGNPGIGKTTSTPILIRMLIQAKKTVVYLIRTNKVNGWYYEFTPDAKSNDRYTVNVYPEATNIAHIESLKNPLTYYVVDPGKTKDSCDQEDTFVAKTIIVASPDDGHWGFSEFDKVRDDVEGFFKYFPLWSREELLNAGRILEPTFTEAQIEQRYEQCGGVPRYVFGDDDSLTKILTKQNMALNELTESQVRQLANGELDAVQSNSDKQPRSVLIGYEISERDDGSFVKTKVIVLSSLIKQKMSVMFIKILWYFMKDPRYKDWKIFEWYTHELMTKREAAPYEYRKCCGQRNFKGIGRNKNLTVLLGGCVSKRQVVDIVEHAKQTPNVLFHSLDPSYELIDFIYQDGKGAFHAFQATIGKTHSADTDKIRNLQTQVGVKKKLALYYLVPGENYISFMTSPVNPNKWGVSCKVWIVSIPDPNESD